MAVFKRSMVIMGIVSLFVGCATTETTVANGTASVASVATEAVSASMSTETAAVSKAALPPPPSSQTDILSGAKKPCGTVAADAPKFVEPESK